MTGNNSHHDLSIRPLSPEVQFEPTSPVKSLGSELAQLRIDHIRQQHQVKGETKGHQRVEEDFRAFRSLNKIKSWGDEESGGAKGAWFTLCLHTTRTSAYEWPVTRDLTTLASMSSGGRGSKRGNVYLTISFASRGSWSLINTSFDTNSSSKVLD
jgi:hypothetical protein